MYKDIYEFWLLEKVLNWENLSFLQKIKIFKNIESDYWLKKISIPDQVLQRQPRSSHWVKFGSLVHAEQVLLVKQIVLMLKVVSDIRQIDCRMQGKY